MPSHPKDRQDLGENMPPVDENRSRKNDQSAKPAGLSCHLALDRPNRTYGHLINLGYSSFWRQNRGQKRGSGGLLGPPRGHGQVRR